MIFYKKHAPKFRNHSIERSDLSFLEGIKLLDRESEIPEREWIRGVEKIKKFGLEPAESIEDKSDIIYFQRGELPHESGISTMIKSTFLEDVRQVGQYDVDFVGVPFDIGSTYRTGTRFGPEAMRKISSLYGTYNFDMGVDLRESLICCDVGDIFCPANITKSHDQIRKGITHILSANTMPMIMRGDRSTGYPCVRGITECVEGNVGIIHFDQHIDTQEKDMDEIMHTCPWFQATNVPNYPPVNLVLVVSRFQGQVFAQGNHEGHSCDHQRY